MLTSPAYKEIIDFIAAGTTPHNLLSFHPSPTAKQRVWELVAREKNEGLTVEETAELNHYLQIEHLMRLAKARARYHLQNE